MPESFPSIGRLVSSSLLAAAVLSLAGLPALAQSQSAAPPSEWSVTVTPYAWLMGLNGSLIAKGQIVDVNANIVDILGKTDSLFGLMADMEVRKGRYAGYFDFVYTSLNASGGLSGHRNPLPSVNVSLAANGGVKTTMMILEGGLAYELYRSDSTEAPDVPAALRPGSSIDAILGVRYWHVTNDVTMGFQGNFNFQGPVFGLISVDRSRNIAVASTGSMDWADPLIGLRLRQRIAPHHEVQLRGDVGGTGNSLSWQLFAGYGYTFSSGTTSWSAVLGYRALGVNYSQSGGLDGINAVLHGPVVGLTIRF